jgi:lipopolysaccharide biosynthesis glycosyltransferase
MDYQSPDHGQTSGNLGDYVQSLALLGNLVRMSDVRFSGDGGLGALASELQGRVRPELRRPGVHGAVHLVAVDRDFSDGAAVPRGTWFVAHGWHMHPLFELRYDFPYDPAIHPLFVSFHLNRLDLLTESAKTYLREHGPVGCRDWDTVFLLLSAGIDAFFTGCLTTTVDALFPRREAVRQRDDVVGVIDLPATSAGRDARHVRVFSHQADEYRYMSLTDGLRAASTTLAGHQRDLDRAVTGRLHAYLPLTALGVPVDFKPRSTGDVRFAGLTGLRPDDERLTAMRDGLRDLLAQAFDRIVAGATPDEVYATWHEITRDRVAEAKARLVQPVVDAPTTIDVAAAAASSLAASRRFGPHDAVDSATVSDVVLAYDQNLTEPAAVLIESMLANASGPIRLWILGRGLSDAYHAWLATAFPSLPITFVPCDRIVYGPAGRPRRITGRITISTMDRLLLPAILPDVQRVVYLDVDTIVLGDVCELAGTDLGGRPLAARDSFVSETREWRQVATRLPEDEATGLRRRMAAAHGYGHPALNAGVLVLDLDRLRRDDFAATYLALVERYGLNDQDTMLAYAGPDRAVLPPAWNALPGLEDVPDPKLIHWASLGKPWEPALTFAQDRWRVYAAQLHECAGDPPVADDATT